ncbi:MAG TPA: M3 family oligoendopeptidase [Anaerolineales bacterium]|nr:M3 family oligoendopeptidase [Anaerolineales bacterium]
MNANQELPRWNLTNVYPDLDHPDFSQAVERLEQLIEDLKVYLDDHQIDPAQSPLHREPVELAEVISGFIERTAQAQELRETLRAYLNSFISTDSFNEKAKKQLSLLEPTFVKLDQIEAVKFQGWLGKLGDKIDQVIGLSPTVTEHAFYLTNTVEQSVYMMSPAEEELASELFLSGATAWNKLQSNLTSQLSWPLENENGEETPLPMTAIINLRSHPDESMRRKGYEAELAAWKTIETPLAAAMNGVKGSQTTIFKRRGREDAVHKSLDQARIDRATLEAMLSAIRGSLPMFRKYFRAKAKRLGKSHLPWWDLFAPMGKSDRSFNYPEAQNFVLENFAKFSEDLADYANTAFTNQWIDVGPRRGKRAGAFCMRVPGVKESRILLNFEGNLDWVFTLAHELGHGFHNHCLYEAGRNVLQIRTPMTLAETASIMCETIVTNAAIKMANDEDEELLILETALIGDSQVVVDIYSRYLFETEVFKRREKAELSGAEFNEIMEWAQGETYGDGLDPDYRQKYMWTWKPHYYYPGLAFYNYPYAFGLLFGTGLYAIYLARGDAFVPEYKALLASTGMGTAVELAARFDIDLRSQSFWEESLKVIGERVERYTQL